MFILVIFGAVLFIGVFAAITECWRVPMEGDIVRDAAGKSYVVIGSSMYGDEVELREVSPDTFDVIYNSVTIRKPVKEVTITHINWNNPFRRS